MKTVYIASPYTIGDVVLNVRKSIEAADILLKCGFIPFVPLLTHFWHFISPKPADIWYWYDNEWVKKCDFLLRLEGESIGADKEVLLAEENNIPVFYSIQDLFDKEGE